MSERASQIQEILRAHFPAIYQQELRDEIASVGKIVSLDADAVMMDIGGFIQSIPLVVEGSVKIMREDDEGNELFLYYLTEGQTCAMSLTCCLSAQESQIRAVTEEPTSMIMVPAEYMDKWMFEYPAWKNFIMQTYSVRFEELLKAIDHVAFMKMDERLLHYLGEKSRVTGKQVFNVTHQQIAYELHTSREVISRLLKKLEGLGKIRLGRNRIELVDPITSS